MKNVETMIEKYSDEPLSRAVAFLKKRFDLSASISPLVPGNIISDISIFNQVSEYIAKILEIKKENIIDTKPYPHNLIEKLYYDEIIKGNIMVRVPYLNLYSEKLDIHGYEQTLVENLGKDLIEHPSKNPKRIIVASHLDAFDENSFKKIIAFGESDFSVFRYCFYISRGEKLYKSNLHE